MLVSLFRICIIGLARIEIDLRQDAASRGRFKQQYLIKITGASDFFVNITISRLDNTVKGTDDELISYADDFLKAMVSI